MGEEKYTAGNGRYEITIGRWLQGQTVSVWDNETREMRDTVRVMCEHGYEAACMVAEDQLGADVDQEMPQELHDELSAEEDAADRSPGIG